MFCDNITILKHGYIFKLLNTEYKYFYCIFQNNVV